MLDTNPLYLLSALVPLVPLGIGLYYIKRLGYARKLLTVLMGLSSITQIIALAYFLVNENNLFIYHMYMPLEFILLGYMYKIWLKDWWKGWIIDLIIWAYVGLSILNTLFIQTPDTVNSYALFLGGAFLIIFAIAFFYRILDEMKLRSLESSFEFWINASILLYYSGSVLILGLNHLISMKSVELIETLYVFHSCFNILHYLLFGIGLWIKPKQ